MSSWLRALQNEHGHKQDPNPLQTMKVLALGLRQGRHQKKSQKTPMKNESHNQKREGDPTKHSENRKQQGKEQRENSPNYIFW